MQHEMHLEELPFRLIQSGKKTVELRLNDAKRRRIKPDDTICLRLRGPRGEVIGVKVLRLLHAQDFKLLLSHLTPACLGLTEAEFADTPERMTRHYSTDEQKRHGVVAIFLQLVATQ